MGLYFFWIDEEKTGPPNLADHIKVAHTEASKPARTQSRI